MKSYAIVTCLVIGLLASSCASRPHITAKRHRQQARASWAKRTIRNLTTTDNYSSQYFQR